MNFFLKKTIKCLALNNIAASPNSVNTYTLTTIFFQIFILEYCINQRSRIYRNRLAKIGISNNFSFLKV